MVLENSLQKISWNTHYLLTRAALRSCDSASLGTKIRVVSIEEFLHATKEELPAMAHVFWELLATRTGLPASNNREPMAIVTWSDFLTAFRLNPHQPMHYVKVITPREVTAEAPHDPARHIPPYGAYRTVKEQEPCTVSETFATYCDEPDWGMDQNLFVVEQYRLGSPPFGSATGRSSQACFHMAFLHEGPVLSRIAPDLSRTFLDLRVHMFLNLADLAMSKGIEYWAWRFAAWAAHYLQDLTQPYHARALPFRSWAVLGRFILNPRPASFAEKNKNLLKNRHLLFEAAVHLIINDAAKKHVDHQFFDALKGDGRCVQGNLSAILQETSRDSAGLAFRVNRVLWHVLNDPLLNRPEYSVVSDKSYPLQEKLSEAWDRRRESVIEFLDLVSVCLEQTGRVTRYVVQQMTGHANR